MRLGLACLAPAAGKEGDIAEPAVVGAAVMCPAFVAMACRRCACGMMIAGLASGMLAVAARMLAMTPGRMAMLG